MHRGAKLCVVVGLLSVAASVVPSIVNAVSGPTWSAPRPAAFPVDVQNTEPDAVLHSVSCAPSGGCTAVGFFADSDGYRQAFTQSSSGGSWSLARPVVFPGGVQSTEPNGDLKSVSCVSAGECTAVGSFEDADGFTQAFTVALSGGSWSLARPVVFPDDTQSTAPYTKLLSVSCVAAGECTAAGRFTDSGSYLAAFTVTLSEGAWGLAEHATFEVDAESASPNSGFDSVSCASAGDCTAVGFFKDKDGTYQAITSSSIDGSWGTVRPEVFAADVQSDTPEARLMSVSCVVTGECVAGGYFSASAGGRQPFSQTLEDGTWSQARPAVFAAGSEASILDGRFNEVSCASAGNCAAVGYVVGLEGGLVAFTQMLEDGTWSPARPVAFALGAAAVGSSSDLFAVSCGSVGNCTAAGRFGEYEGAQQAFTQTFAVAAPPVLPPTGSSFSLLLALALILVGSALLVAGSFGSRWRRLTD